MNRRNRRFGSTCHSNELCGSCRTFLDAARIEEFPAAERRVENRKYEPKKRKNKSGKNAFPIASAAVGIRQKKSEYRS
jgi:hypothetical protein